MEDEPAISGQSDEADGDGGLLPGGPGWLLRDVAVLLVTADRRYLMQLRDDLPWLRVPSHWALFGGRVEDSETPRQAALRELMEELEFQPGKLDWFTETGFIMPQLDVGASRKVFFEARITAEDIARMVLHEGAAMRLFTLQELLSEPRIVPWDIGVVILHARQDQIFRNPAPNPASPNDFTGNETASDRIG
ncbi:NUDIX domain-containing protein (plasmid) [Azospirillum oryzae]|uniref:NUDIX domain-containing protein n=1 Tax=Azospirillum oryzae TaxID=286727 RepID=A0A6N1ABK7_9PROT|nr:NUDIX domain-containing protein [Azospirillum oryzae]KAA0586635.1 NUDIX domain-containing protein [Azospirillum oryzae]QKS49081.1 NUDIX domain-containing protein [Azospirillum oryzae]GLR80775.1 hypothetical protein GCM10007856_34550 [Azospirillum oryzae]